MSEEPVHYELFIRRNIHSAWTLEFASESRQAAVVQAEEALSQGRAAGVKVCKESRRANGEYASVVIFSKGDLEPPRRRARPAEVVEAPLCVGPSDLYTVHARARVARLLDGWLARQGVCAFELMHRPDLAERLDATGLELQHAIQKVAIPEAQAKDVSVHEVIRRYQKLAESAIARLIGDARRGVSPDLAVDGMAASLAKATQAQDPAYVLGLAVARALAPALSPLAKISTLLDLADAAPAGAGRRLLFQVIEQPLSEMLGAPQALAQLQGRAADLGETLALIVRLIAPRAVEVLRLSEAGLAALPPPADAEVARLSRWLSDPVLMGARASLARRVLAELLGPRRLHPSDPEAEILSLRSLARVLVLSPEVASPEEVQEAFTSRSRRLLAADFIQAFVERAGGGPLGELQALLRLSENVVGVMNKRSAAVWLKAAAGALRFERACTAAPEAALASLQRLADLQHALARVGFEPADHDEIAGRLGQVGEAVEASARLIQAIVRAPGPPMPRLLLLLRMASGDAAPVGPVSRRARLEIARLMREPGVRAELIAGAPDVRERVRAMVQTSGLAA